MHVRGGEGDISEARSAELADVGWLERHGEMTQFREVWVSNNGSVECSARFSCSNQTCRELREPRCDPVESYAHRVEGLVG